MNKTNTLVAINKARIAQNAVNDQTFMKKGDVVEVDLTNYLTKQDAATTYALKNSPIILGTTSSTVEGAIWLEWS